MAWHSDSEVLFQGTHHAIRIVSLSLGDSRTFQVRGNRKGGPHVSQLLMDGDLCLMDGWFQKYFQHSVPKDFGAKEERFNLTWRWMRQHKESCRASAAE